MDKENYKTPVAVFLNNFAIKCKSISEGKIIFLDLLFNKFLNNCNQLREQAFFGANKQFPTLAFESIFVAACIEACSQ